MTVSIRFVLLFGFCGLLIASLVAVTVVGLSSALDNTLVLLARESEQMLNEAEHRLQAELEPVQRQAAYLSEQFEVGNLSFEEPERLIVAMEASMAADPEMEGVLIVDANAYGFWFQGPSTAEDGQSYLQGEFGSDSGVVLAVQLSRLVSFPEWQQPIWVPELSKTIINLQTPLRRDGVFVGTAIHTMDIGNLSARLRALQDFEGKVPFLLYGEDRVLAHPGLADLHYDGSEAEPLPPLDTFQDGILTQFPAIEPPFFRRLKNQENIQRGWAQFGDEGYLFTYRTIEGIAADLPVTIGIYVNENRYTPLTDRLWKLFQVGAGILIVSIFLALWMARSTGRPIQALAKASSHIAGGEYDKVGTLPHSRMRELDEASTAFERMVDGLKERERMRDLFGRVMPKKVANILLQSPEGLKPQSVEATVLFCDIAGFTKMTQELGPDGTVGVLNAYSTDLVDIVHEFDGIVTQFQGDAILAVFNVPLPDPEHAKKAVLTACKIQSHLQNRTFGGQNIESRVGIATGPLIAANVGAESRMNYTVHGDTVNLATRLESLNKEFGSKILIPDATANQLDGIPLNAVGLLEIRGQSNPVHVFEPIVAAA